MGADWIREQALKELAQEDYRRRVEAKKETLRRLPWWKRLFPWRLKIYMRRIDQ